MYIGVDVGTGSARAGVFDKDGTLLASHKHEIAMWREVGGIVEQSSDDIWAAVCTSVREAVARAGISSDAVRGIGFDAACSMAVLGRDMRPISISPSGDAARNVIVWMDHRAIAQAEEINAQGHAVLDFVGGRISPEMQTPKLKWIKDHMPDTFAAAGHFLDLPDFLTWSATGSLLRSACTVTCKWTYLAHESRWDESYFEQIGLPELPAETYARIGQDIVAPGTALQNGLTAEAAEQMGLCAGTPVGAGLIDAHAGGVGTVGADPENTMAYVFGTSACTMATGPQPQKVPGIWGPYYSAMVPGKWLFEGGQSAAGEAIAHLLSCHPASQAAREQAQADGMSLEAYLLSDVERRASDVSEAVHIADARVIVPDILGNRAPYADPSATGIVSGITAAKDYEDLLATYVAAVFGVGYGLRQIMQAQSEHGVSPSTIVVSGGAASSPSIQQLLADSSGKKIVATRCPEPVLLGAAMLGAVAAKGFSSLTEAMAKMTAIAQELDPNPSFSAHHDVRYRAFQCLQESDRELRKSLSAIAE